ncbi:ABC transporter ATP-binding protein [Ammonifex thiophilus]|uniref:Nickel import system ATP-binding protein NikD n=1 Tax=Ammonifex thiophilus TaxID=444093 RepID=A0A3D8P130_9THEO|nr:ABC transporter ATP-binding protein [Ammonifex thiophilus]
MVAGGSVAGPDPTSPGHHLSGAGPRADCRSAPACWGCASVSRLEVKKLCCHFATEGGRIEAVNGVSFSLAAGEAVGLVGESGCGKTTLALAVMGLLPPTARVSGSVSFRGKNLLELSEAEKDLFRWRHIAMVFQNSAEVLNPMLSVGEQIAEPLRRHLGLGRREAEKRSQELLEMVGLGGEWACRYPHQLSGGMRQRALLALALACEPEILLVDEPTSSLDPDSREEILRLLAELQNRYGFSLLLISHDLSAVARLTSRLLVMYAGRVVEEGPTEEVIARPMHPYTRGLISSTPHLFPYRDLWGIPGETPGLKLPSGCAFHPRCTQAVEKCRQEAPGLAPLPGGRRVACHRGGIVTLLEAKGIRHEYQLARGRRL